MRLLCLSLSLCAFASGSTFSSAGQSPEGIPFAQVWAQGDNNPASVSAGFSANDVLTITGGTGEAFAVFLGGYADGDYTAGSPRSLSSGSASAYWNSGGCMAYNNGFGLLSTCYKDEMPFEFGVPQTVTLSASASAYSYPGAGKLYGDAGFSTPLLGIADANGRPLSGNFSYTITPVPTPEPGTLALLAGMVCAGLMACKLRR